MLAQLRALLVDLDGVVYRGNTALPGANELIPALKRLGISYAFVTNNATMTPEQTAEKLQRLGVAADQADIVTSPLATAAYLRTVTPTAARVLVVGEQGLVRAIEEAGFVVVNDARADFVVVGLDREFTYRKLVTASEAVWHGAKLVATNADAALPVEGTLRPGAGSILASVAFATGVEPIVVGKPEPTILRMALQRLGGVAPDETGMVGDRPDTDMRAALAAGMHAILVESELAPPEKQGGAELVVRNLADLIDRLEADHAGRPSPVAEEGQGTR